MKKIMPFFEYVKLAGLSAVGVLCFGLSSLYAQNPDRSSPPELGPPPSLMLPEIQHTKLSNGLEVVILEKHQVPIVQINLLIRTGSAHEPAGKSGLAKMMAAMLDEGAASYDALALADAIDFLGANLSTFAGYHTSGVFLNTPVAKLDRALDLMADIALRPTFPAEELQRLRKERLTTLLQSHDRPTTIAFELFNSVLYGKKHPYGALSNGSEKTLRALQVADLAHFHRQYFHPNNATLIVVGDVETESVRPKLTKAFGNWQPGDTPKKPRWPAVKQVDKREIYLVDKPGAAQSVIRIGRIGVPRMTEDYDALVVMNTILGGSFTSRLNQNLREQHGYSYGAGSGFSFRQYAGPFVASASVQTDVTDKALVEFMKELNGILEPVPDEELMRARNYVALRFPGRFQSVSQIAGQIGELVEYELPDDYFNTYIKNILTVTKEDVQRVAKKYLDPEKSAIVVVGDRKKIEAGIRALKLGSIKNLTIEDVLGKLPAIEGTN